MVKVFCTAPSEQPYFTCDRLRLPLDGEGVLYGPLLVGNEGLVDEGGVLVPEHAGRGFTCIIMGFIIIIIISIIINLIMSFSMSFSWALL
jgi:hypothetical protein